jgi:ketosteroid isomerase-like protein
VVLAAVSVDAQQALTADEKQIRSLIAAADAGKPLPAAKDRIFWSGAIRTPVVGSQQAEEVPSDRRLSLRVPGSQKSKTTVCRIEIAKSGDLAYEFSDSELSFDLKDGKRESLPTSALRVWKKEGGEWKVAAQFSRPHQ